MLRTYIQCLARVNIETSNACTYGFSRKLCMKSDLESKNLKTEERNKFRPEVGFQVSINYLKSESYRQTYGESLVWEQYRRNHKGMFAPKKTRKTCIRGGMISTGNPCPICRDEYLVLDYRNIDLLKQFISPYTGEILSYSKTGLCQKKHFQLVAAIQKAMDYGLLTFNVPFREFNYSEYYDNYESMTNENNRN